MIPVLKAKCTQTVHPDGRVDVVAEVPLLDLAGSSEGGYEYAKKVLIEKFNLTPEQADIKLTEALERTKGK